MAQDMNQTTAEQKILLTPLDVKSILHIGENKVYALFSNKNFPAIVIGGSKYIQYTDFIKWLDNIKKLPNRTFPI